MEPACARWGISQPHERIKHKQEQQFCCRPRPWTAAPTQRFSSSESFISQGEHDLPHLHQMIVEMRSNKLKSLSNLKLRLLAKLWVVAFDFAMPISYPPCPGPLYRRKVEQHHPAVQTESTANTTGKTSNISRCEALLA